MARSFSIAARSLALGGYLISHPFGMAEASPITGPVSPSAREQPQLTQLPWPVEFQDSRHNLGHNLLQFQRDSASEAYFHGGCDLRTQPGAWVSSPVSGRLEAGHFSYTTQADGSRLKQLRPWPQDGDRLYFELSVISDEGYRFELQHIDRRSIPTALVRALNRGDARVETGQRLGKVIRWPERGADGSHYHHLHYNILNAQGIPLNPEALSPFFEDDRAPEILGSWAIDSYGRVESFARGDTLNRSTVEIVLSVIDRRGENVYVQAPPFVSLMFASGERSLWDFRESLVDSQGHFPNIWDVYKSELVLPDGQLVQTRSDLHSSTFLMRLPVPAGASGPFSIRVGDMADNLTWLNGQIR